MSPHLILKLLNLWQSLGVLLCLQTKRATPKGGNTGGKGEKKAMKNIIIMQDLEIRCKKTKLKTVMPLQYIVNDNDRVVYAECKGCEEWCCCEECNSCVERVNSLILHDLGEPKLTLM